MSINTNVISCMLGVQKVCLSACGNRGNTKAIVVVDIFGWRKHRRGPPLLLLFLLLLRIPKKDYYYFIESSKLFTSHVYL